MTTGSRQNQLADDAFFVVRSALSNERVDAVIRDMETAFAADRSDSTLRAADGRIYGARNLLQLWPTVVEAYQQPALLDILRETLGTRFGLVRVLFFDKPPEQSWALPWHKDRAIAVKNNRLASEHFCKPTWKVGVPHVNAPAWLLEKMLTLRLHLDAMTEENGPLKVLPGSHRNNADSPPVTILGKRGDVLLMRPLLSHCSNRSLPETKQHRRILHFEFAGVEELADGYAWHDFIAPRFDRLGR